jgi:hypothetical protein
MLMNCFGNYPVVIYILLALQIFSSRMSATLSIGTYTTGYNKTDTALGALSKESGHSVVAVFSLFKTCMHRPHQDSVFKLGKAKV